MKQRRTMFGVKTALALSIFMLSPVTSFAAVDACSDNTMATGGTSVQGQNNSSSTGNISGTPYHYEMWYQGGNNTMKYYSDGTFSATWNGSDDFLARVGLKYNSDKTHDQIGYFTADYNYTKSGTAGYGYIGIYGWSKDPEVEYYIVDDWFSKPNPQYLGTLMGEITVDGGTYDIYTFTRVNMPSISGTSTFPQFFSVRREARSCGHIDISAHFKKWDELFHGQTGSSGVTLKLGKLYEVKLLAEAGGSATGKIDYTYLNMTSDGSPTGEEPVTPEVPQEPFKGEIAIPGTVEMENYDVGGKNNAFYDSDGTNEGDATYREGDGVDIVTVDGGYAVGYTIAGEWLEYTVNIESDGIYNFEVKAATGAQSETTLSLTLDSVSIASPISIPNTADDWATYQTVTGKTTSLKAGVHVLRLSFDVDYTNVDWIKFSKEGEEPPVSINMNVSGMQTSVDYEVFDLQGKSIGKVFANKAGSLSEALAAKFQRSGLYLVKNGNRIQKVVVKK